MVKSVKKKKKKKKIPALLKRLSAIPAELPHTTPSCSQWRCPNLTEWAQGFVYLKPLTYFYSKCRNQSLYYMIVKLMPCIHSKTERTCWAKDGGYERVGTHSRCAWRDLDFLVFIPTVRLKLASLVQEVHRKRVRTRTDVISPDASSCWKRKKQQAARGRRAKHSGGVIPQWEHIQTYQKYLQTAAALWFFRWLARIRPTWLKVTRER